MKGVELPVNVLVVVAIAIIVLLGLVAFYLFGFSQTWNIQATAAWSSGCGNITSRCLTATQSDFEQTKVDVDVNRDGNYDLTSDNLWALCTALGKGTDLASCKRACGCAI